MRAWHKRLFWPVTVGALLLLAAWWWYASNSPMARLRASGAPTCYEDLTAAPIPDSDNILAGLRDLSEPIGAIPVGLVEFHASLNDGPIPPDRLTEAWGWLQPQEDTTRALIEVSRRPEVAFLLTADQLADEQGMLDRVGPIKDAARLLDLSATYDLGNGEVAAASEKTLAALRLAKASESEPFLTGRLVACAAQSLAIRNAERLAVRGNTPPQVLRSLDDALAPLEDRSSLIEALKFQRVQTIERLREMSPLATMFQNRGLLKAYERAIAGVEEANGDPDRIATIPNQSLKGLAATLAPALQSLYAVEARVGREARAVRRRIAERLAPAPTE